MLMMTLIHKTMVVDQAIRPKICLLEVVTSKIKL